MRRQSSALNEMPSEEVGAATGLQHRLRRLGGSSEPHDVVDALCSGRQTPACRLQVGLLEERREDGRRSKGYRLYEASPAGSTKLAYQMLAQLHFPSEFHVRTDRPSRLLKAALDIVAECFKFVRMPSLKAGELC